MTRARLLLFQVRRCILKRGAVFARADFNRKEDIKESIHAPGEIKMLYTKVIFLLLIVLALNACGNSRESELEELWARAVQQDTIAGYIHFLANQKKEEDEAIGKVTPYREYWGRRSTVAAARIFDLTLENIRGACPFDTLYVDLRQDINNVDQSFSFHSSRLADALRQLGVSLTTEQNAPEETLVFVLNGRGNISEYVPQQGGSHTPVKTISGGAVEGDIWFVSRPQDKVSYHGKFELMQVLPESEASYVGKVFPKALVYAMDDSKISNSFAKLVYDMCGPAAGAYIYFGSELRGNLHSEKVDDDLEARMEKDIDKVRPVVIAASFGSGMLGNENDIFYSRSEKALRFLVNSSGDNKEIIISGWKNTQPFGALPDWLSAKNE